MISAFILLLKNSLVEIEGSCCYILNLSVEIHGTNPWHISCFTQVTFNQLFLEAFMPSLTEEKTLPMVKRVGPLTCYTIEQC